MKNVFTKILIVFIVIYCFIVLEFFSYENRVFMFTYESFLQAKLIVVTENDFIDDINKLTELSEEQVAAINADAKRATCVLDLGEDRIIGAHVLKRDGWESEHIETFHAELDKKVVASSWRVDEKKQKLFFRRIHYLLEKMQDPNVKGVRPWDKLIAKIEEIFRLIDDSSMDFEKKQILSELMTALTVMGISTEHEVWTQFQNLLLQFNSSFQIDDAVSLEQEKANSIRMQV